MGLWEYKRDAGEVTANSSSLCLSTPQKQIFSLFSTFFVSTNLNQTNMQSAIVFVALMAAAASAQLIGAPATSVVTQQRLGGNFAYTIGHQPAYAYQAGYPYAAYNAAYNTPAATYKTVAGVSPLAYNTLGYNNVVGYNGLGYKGLGYNGLGYNGLGYNGVYNGLGYNGVYNGLGYNGVYNRLGYNGYTTVV